jgi:hypothetical protein
MIPDSSDPRHVGELFLEDPARIAKAAPALPPDVYLAHGSDAPLGRPAHPGGRAMDDA